jgi:hypothetical protein
MSDLSLGRTRNMHLAAQQMNLSQPAISKMLKEIESLLGFALFERQPRSMPPTALGEHVLRYAQIALNDARSFVEQISSLREGGHGHLKVGGIFAATAVALPVSPIRASSSAMTSSLWRRSRFASWSTAAIHWPTPGRLLYSNWWICRGFSTRSARRFAGAWNWRSPKRG